MTWHFFASDEFICPSCETAFVPYENPQACPKCGALSNSETNFQSELIHGLRIHKADYGSYTSGAYFVGGNAENVFHWCCRILDEASDRCDGLTSSENVQRCLDNIDWGDSGHIKTYFSSLIRIVIQQLSVQPTDGEGA